MSSAADETAITEITITPDGRVYVFGASAGVLEVMGTLDSQNAELRQRINQSRKTAPASPVVDVTSGGSGNLSL